MRGARGQQSSGQCGNGSGGTDECLPDADDRGVVLEILPDPKSPSGYRWTSRKGYPRKIVNGMLGEVIINTSYRAPASYVIPALRELMNRKQVKKKPSDE